MMMYISLVLLRYKLEKICDNKKLSPAAKAHKIENALRRSRCSTLRRSVTENDADIDEAVRLICDIKSISLQDHPKFAMHLRVILSQIKGYRRLKTDIDAIRRIQYDSENADHEQKLLEIWGKLKPEEPLTSRISRQWTEIGFQGDDPMTDFRGMGQLGLDNLHYFCTEQTQKAQALLLHSQHPQYGYSLAIVGINLTSLAIQLMNSNALKTHFYNAVYAPPKVIHFHYLFAYLITEFDKFWFEEKPRDIMEFNRVRDKFHKHLLHRLKSKSALLGNKVSTYM